MAYTYKYPRPAVTADCVVITKEAEPKVLLIQRGNEPFKDCWAFPGGFMEMDETTEQCAVRELKEETGLDVAAHGELKEIGVYSKVERDPRGRVISVAYLAFIDQPKEVKGLDDAANAQWFNLNELPPLAFDHAEIIADAKAKLKLLNQQTIAFADKYLQFFSETSESNSDWKYRFFDSGEFPDECWSLCFDMDCGHSFIEAYGEEAWRSLDGLKHVIDKMDNIYLIGNGLFSQWRGFNHWSSPSYADDDTKEWFVLLLTRLKTLCENRI